MGQLPKANKDLGQHFLRDQKVIQTITEDWKDQYDIIVEVGPGPAVLTKHLQHMEAPLYLIEKDTRFVELLEQTTSKENIFIQDALEFEWNKFITDNKLQDKKIWVVSNLPYNVGTILFTQFLQIPQIQFMTLMFQKEVGDKTYLRQAKNQMNGLLFLSLNYFESKQLIKVLPGAFSPPPKVDSVVVSYTRKDSPQVSIEEYEKLNKFTRTLFSQRRKQIGGILKKGYPQVHFQVQSEATLKKRAEALDLAEVYQLFSFLK